MAFFASGASMHSTQRPATSHREMRPDRSSPWFSSTWGCEGVCVWVWVCACVCGGSGGGGVCVGGRGGDVGRGGGEGSETFLCSSVHLERICTVWQCSTGQRGANTVNSALLYTAHCNAADTTQQQYTAAHSLLHITTQHSTAQYIAYTTAKHATV